MSEQTDGADPRWAIRLAEPSFDDGDIEAVTALLKAGALAGGEQVPALERELESGSGVHVSAVSSGTAALHLAARALGLGAGAPVLVPAFTFAASANAFLANGCSVVPVDVDADTYNISCSDLSRAIDEHRDARAVVVVDLYGSTAGTDDAIDMARQRGLVVIEDAAQAHGATDSRGQPVGRRADATTLSFYATKNVAAGEGGAVLSPDPSLVQEVSLLRSHGSVDARVFSRISLTYRMTELAACLARRQLSRLAENNARRQKNARAVAERFVSVWGDRVVVPSVAGEADGGHVFHQFTVKFRTPQDREVARRRLGELGVETKVFYPYTIGELPGVTSRPTPVAEHLRDRVLSIPVHPNIGAERIDLLLDAIREAARD